MSTSDPVTLTPVFTYRRVSTETQVKEGYGLEEQLHQLREYCAKENFAIVGEFADEGISGAGVDESDFSLQRPGLEDLLADLKSSGVKYVVVLTTSRLWRSDMAKILIQRELRRHNVDVKSIDRPTYSIYHQDKDPSSFLVNSMLEVLDSYERLEIRLKLLRGRKRKASNGGYAGGRAPFGYNDGLASKTMEVNAQQAAVVQLIFELRDRGLTLDSIAKQLNSLGHKTTMGKDFRFQQVSDILKRRDFYAGIYQYGDITSQGQHTPLIEALTEV